MVVNDARSTHGLGMVAIEAAEEGMTPGLVLPLRGDFNRDVVI